MCIIHIHLYLECKDCCGRFIYVTCMLLYVDWCVTGMDNCGHCCVDQSIVCEDSVVVEGSSGVSVAFCVTLRLSLMLA